MFWGFNFEHYLRYPIIIKDIMVYAGFRDAWQDIPDPPPAQSAPDQHNEENMYARPDQEEMGQAINKFLELLEKQEKKGWLPYCHTCPRLHKGLLAQVLHICGLGYGGWFSHSTGQRSGRYVHPIGVAPVQTRWGPQVTIPGYPGLSQFIWWYPWPVNSTILVLLLLENNSIEQYERYFFGVRWQNSVLLALSRQGDYLGGSSPRLCPPLPQARQFIQLYWAVWGLSGSNASLVASHLQ